jgi:hypothetical protein
LEGRRGRKEGLIESAVIQSPDPPRYRWLFYINPNYYGFSAMTRVVLESVDLGCSHQSPIECYPTSAGYIISYFSLDLTNPYASIMVSVAVCSLAVNGAPPHTYIGCRSRFRQSNGGWGCAVLKQHLSYLAMLIV